MIHRDFSLFARLFIAVIILTVMTALSLNRSQLWADISVNSLLQCTNEIRSELQLDRVFLNSRLQKAAQAKLIDMEAYQYWAHQNPETGKMPWEFIDEAGYPYTSAGENLAIGYSIGDHVCEAWKASPPHFANLAAESFQEVGFAAEKVDLGEKKGVLIVQLLGQRTDFTTPRLTNNLAGQLIFSPLSITLGTITMIMMIGLSLASLMALHHQLRQRK